MIVRKMTIAALVFLISHATFANEKSAQYENGKVVFNEWCWECHGKSNPHGSGTWSIRKRDGDAISPYIEDRVGLSYEYLEHIIRNGQLFMPRFRHTEISNDDLRDLTAYLWKEPK